MVVKKKGSPKPSELPEKTNRRRQTEEDKQEKPTVPTEAKDAPRRWEPTEGKPKDQQPTEVEA